MNRRTIHVQDRRSSYVDLPPPRKLHNLTKDERDRTPYDFAEYLIESVRLRLGAVVVAALWVLPDSYYRLFRGVECWDGRITDLHNRDAMRYQGPWPIIAHPPCGPWGYLINNSHETDEHGIRAMEYVHQYGGVVEQPLGSQLFRQYGIIGGKIEKVYQYDFGHRALKRTILYWYKPRKISGWAKRPR